MYTIAAHFHLHTESGEQLLEGGGHCNHTQIDSPVARRSRGYMCLMVKGHCMYTHRMINY